MGHIADEDLPPKAEIDPEYHWIWRCWRRLGADRPQYGGGLGPSVPGDIPWSLVRLWAEHHEMSRAQFNFLDHCIQAMDRTYRAWVVEHPPQENVTARTR